MAEHGRIGHPELVESFHEESRLSCCGPDPEPWPLTMPKPWPIEAQDTIGLSKKINKPADREILDHGSIAMEQHDARSGRVTAFNVRGAGGVEGQLALRTRPILFTIVLAFRPPCDEMA